jgi:hypothetical protein
LPTGPPVLFGLRAEQYVGELPVFKRTNVYVAERGYRPFGCGSWPEPSF